MLKDKEENKKRAKEMIKSALIVGPIMPIMTVAFMYVGFKLGSQLGKPFDMLLSLSGAMLGFSLGTIMIWFIIKIITKRMRDVKQS
ncbi:MAG: hypothetical protein QXG01_02045 [Candidatus Bathyarchaeia archaeon]